MADESNNQLRALHAVAYRSRLNDSMID